SQRDHRDGFERYRSIARTVSRSLTMDTAIIFRSLGARIRTRRPFLLQRLFPFRQSFHFIGNFVRSSNTLKVGPRLEAVLLKERELSKRSWLCENWRRFPNIHERRCNSPCHDSQPWFNTSFFA